MDPNRLLSMGQESRLSHLHMMRPNPLHRQHRDGRAPLSSNSEQCFERRVIVWSRSSRLNLGRRRATHHDIFENIYSKCLQVDIFRKFSHSKNTHYTVCFKVTYTKIWNFQLE